ncbi:MAG: FAA hydrolase family protein [Microbacterium sp.]|nr:MAG: FAA hydrolase family protein [Microbacterium sp.]
MRLMRVGSPGEETPVVCADGTTWLDARPVVSDYGPEFFAGDGIARLREAIAGGALAPVNVDGERIGPPLVRPPSMLCIGMNYAAHAAESGALPPEEIVVFFKKTNTVTGPHDAIHAVQAESTLDWEVELGVVIGAPLFGEVEEETAMQAVAGYVLANDLSDRWLQLDRSGGQWSKGKSFPGSGALGPWIATTDEIPDPQALGLRSWVNDEPRQASTTADMVFAVARILTDLARVMALEPGDVILTGTPEGVALSGRFPYLSRGDTVRMTIDGLGEIVQTVGPPAL